MHARCPRRRSRIHRAGFTILELVVIAIVITIIFVVVVLPMTMPCCGPRAGARSLKDKTQVKQIHQFMLVYASDHDGSLPLPGLIDQTDRNAEDTTVNHTAPLYSFMIAQNLINTEILFGPTERNPNIQENRAYNYDAYNPTNDTYWDPTFKVDLRTTSHTSYAHMALCGDQRHTQWRDTADPETVMLGTRGPENGATAGSAYTNSITLQLHGPEDQWVGNIVFADNHVETLDKLEPPNLQTPGASQPWNLFHMTGGALGISLGSTEDTVTRVWDPLLKK